MRATSRKGKISGVAADLFREAKALLAGQDMVNPALNRQASEKLRGRLRDLQYEHENQRWGPVRIIHNGNLLLVEKALDIYLWYADSPPHGYKLATDYCQHYDPQHGNGLNGPSRTRVLEIVRFMFTVEAMEDGAR